MEEYALPFRTDRLPSDSCEVVVVGSGVAGLRAALSLAEEYAVRVVTKGKMRASNTQRAQGGIAAVLDPEDSFESHARDTLEAGDGLCDRPAVEALVEEGPAQIEWLEEQGADFDRRDGKLDLTREGGHSHPRIVHGEDATGERIEEALVKRAREHPRLTISEGSTMVDLLADDRRVHGLLLLADGTLRVLWARGVVLATGGLGQVFRETTNHPVATADGTAAVLRAGGCLQDMEFVQFHPTTLYAAGAPRYLISEAMRGEGAVLRDADGNRFLREVHPDAELAPRDVVSRAILEHMIGRDEACVYLDATGLAEDKIQRHFPTIGAVCGRHGIDITEQPIPVRPCVHYAMGGVEATLSGGCGWDNLRVAGEMACTGVHGANRLASNSLLEGLVMGSGAARDLKEGVPPLTKRRFEHDRTGRGSGLDVDDLRRSMKSTMWRRAGILRDAAGLNRARERLERWQDRLRRAPRTKSRDELELLNMMQVARSIVAAALDREESRGAHHRKDYPETDPGARHHSLVRGNARGVDQKPVSR